MQEQKETESTLEKVIRKFALLKFYSQRAMVYYQMVTSFMIWLIFLREYDPAWWVYATSILLLLCLVWVIGSLDKKLKILEYEQTLYNAENKEITEILKTAKEIKLKYSDEKLTNDSWMADWERRWKETSDRLDEAIAKINNLKS